ncbi:hypothetical protein [Acinetobacter oleivorans]|uniref:hypothetical protein n=1 Tax=Acinetobacter oleivorans TaxID=1148157 RepID=UPI00125EC535|nr:hypothetical protein [Acinetobacter oleivorans]
MENKNYHWLILLVILLAVVAAWLSFPIFFEWLITKHFLINPEEYGKKFGAVGDTYGSLNTLISSIALCAVAYSTWLQVTSLQESRKVNEQQLNLAINNHQEQVRESRNAVFANQFYSLLNYKNEKFKELAFCDKNGNKVKGYNFFKILTIELHKKIMVQNYSKIDEINENIIREYFEEVCKNLNNNELYYELFTYLEIYSALIKLINSSDLSQEDKNFYGDLLRTTVAGNEQLSIFLIAPMWERLYSEIRLVAFFNSFNRTEAYEKFALKFYSKGNFAVETWQKVFN